jgi:hypothetical protein
MPGHLKLDYNGFLPRSFQFIIQYNTFIGSCENGN